MLPCPWPSGQHPTSCGPDPTALEEEMVHQAAAEIPERSFLTEEKWTLSWSSPKLGVELTIYC